MLERSQIRGHILYMYFRVRIVITPPSPMHALLFFLSRVIGFGLPFARRYIHRISLTRAQSVLSALEHFYIPLSCPEYILCMVAIGGIVNSYEQ